MGGEFNRWLNISRIDLVGGAEDPDSKIFECEVCIARGTPFEQCHTANYTNQVIGGPPVITVNGEYLGITVIHISFVHKKFVLARNFHATIVCSSQTCTIIVAVLITQVNTFRANFFCRFVQDEDFLITNNLQLLGMGGVGIMVCPN